MDNQILTIKRAQRNVGERLVDTRITEITSCNILEVEVGTTGSRGGDSGHGGRTYFRLKDIAATDMCLKVSDYPAEITIELGGDSEMSTFIEALEFAVKALKEQAHAGSSK